MKRSRDGTVKSKRRRKRRESTDRMMLTTTWRTVVFHQKWILFIHERSRRGGDGVKEKTEELWTDRRKAIKQQGSTETHANTDRPSENTENRLDMLLKPQGDTKTAGNCQNTSLAAELCVQT